MSEWTYINGSILVEVPGKTQEEKDKVVTVLLKELPQVSGNEGPMCVQSLMLRGYGERPNPKLVEEGIVEGPVTQDFYNIVLTGFLRNRFLTDTTDEFYDFLQELYNRVVIRDMTVSINGINEEYEQETRFYDYLFVNELDLDYKVRKSFYERATNGNH